MNIIEVIPIARGIGTETLSYFTAEEVALGSVVHVPLRKKIVPGIVIAIRSATEMRSEIKNLPFEIKKVTSLNAETFFRPEFMDACIETARYFASTTGSALNALVPDYLFEKINEFSTISKEKIKDAKKEKGGKLYEPYVLQADDEERLSHYKSLIREAFARRSSVYICLPTIHDIEALAPQLEKGIEQYTYVLHSELKPKELIETTKKILAEAHPVVIVATGPFLSLPRHDIEMIIVEKENSKSYKLQSRPYLDYRAFAESFAKKIKAKFIVGDIFLQTETMFRYQSGEFHDLYSLKFRALSAAKEEIVDMRAKIDEKKFVYISSKLEALIKNTIDNKEHMYVFTARKGLSPTTVCGDCGTIVRCNTCGNPTVLHGSARLTAPPAQEALRENQSENPSGTGSLENATAFTSGKQNFFLCHTCGERRDAYELCKKCGSWRLFPLGIGGERVAEEIRELFPDIKIFAFDRDIVKSRKKALAIMNEFYSTPGGILVGTEMALLYLDKPIENSAIASIDAFLSIPDYKIPERILSIILKIRAITRRKMILQTRVPDEAVFRRGMSGTIVDFYRDEIALRKRFDYPPFSVLVKLSLEGDKDKIAALMGEAKEVLERPRAENAGRIGTKNYELDIFPSFIRGRRGKAILHGLMKVPRKDWPNDDLYQRLTSLSPQFSIKVDPDSLL